MMPELHHSHILLRIIWVPGAYHGSTARNRAGWQASSCRHHVQHIYLGRRRRLRDIFLSRHISSQTSTFSNSSAAITTTEELLAFSRGDTHPTCSRLLHRRHQAVVIAGLCPPRRESNDKLRRGHAFHRPSSRPFVNCTSPPPSSFRLSYTPPFRRCPQRGQRGVACHLLFKDLAPGCVICHLPRPRHTPASNLKGRP